MAMLKFVRREVHSSGSSSRLSEEDTEAVKKGITKALNAAFDSKYPRNVGNITVTQQLTKGSKLQVWL